MSKFITLLMLFAVMTDALQHNHLFKIIKELSDISFSDFRVFPSSNNGFCFVLLFSFYFSVLPEFFFVQTKSPNQVENRGILDNWRSNIGLILAMSYQYVIRDFMILTWESESKNWFIHTVFSISNNVFGRLSSLVAYFGCFHSKNILLT